MLITKTIFINYLDRGEQFYVRIFTSSHVDVEYSWLRLVDHIAVKEHVLWGVNNQNVTRK